ncbi:unnamed protein product [Diabrotica balteata]|uniref:Uncharacterized protein n=1 Tax=Diabrotica balteata TaxID=107213 RepID=A0A9N9X7Q3_DIABA|nr:unnamed protein product [Diabrotica balteata]
MSDKRSRRILKLALLDMETVREDTASNENADNVLNILPELTTSMTEESTNIRSNDFVNSDVDDSDQDPDYEMDEESADSSGEDAASQEDNLTNNTSTTSNVPLKKRGRKRLEIKDNEDKVCLLQGNEKKVVKRLLTQFNALKLYFTDQSAQNITEAKSILENLNNPQIKLYLEFLLYALPFFNKLNLIMQSEKPQIHIIFEEVAATVKTIMDCYIKDNLLNNHDIINIDFKNPRNFRPLEDMYFGATINSSNLALNLLKEVKLKCLEFYIESIEQILKRFPLKSSVFKYFEFLNPEIVKNRTISSISQVAKYFPNLINNIQDLDNECRL